MTTLSPYVRAPLEHALRDARVERARVTKAVGSLEGQLEERRTELELVAERITDLEAALSIDPKPPEA